MSDAKLKSYLEEMKNKFWHERRHLQHDEIRLQWAAKAASYTSILLDTGAHPLLPEPTSTQGTRMARQSTSRSWVEAPARRRRSDVVTSGELAQRYPDALASQPMSRKRARTSYGPGTTAYNAISPPSLDTNPWQLDSNPPYYGYNNISTSGPSFKARRTSAGRMPINISEESADIRVYEPAEYLQQSGAFTSFGSSLNTRPHLNLNNHRMPSSSLEVPSPFSSSPTTTVSERFTNTTPCTSVAMSREDSLATSFCGALEMMRANSGVSETNSPQNTCRQDTYYSSFSPDGQGISTPFDPSIYFAHAEGTAIEESSASTFPLEQLQLPMASELDTEMKRDVPLSSITAMEQVQSPTSLNLHTKMSRDASSESNVSSVSRISRRSQEQVAQAARPIAPKDVAESPSPTGLSSSMSGGQDMLRQQSAPEPKVWIPKLQYSRQAKEKLKCDRCNKNPDGYRGSHELHRHMALDHNASRTAWVCVDISSDGFLSGCAACESKKPYGQDYNAAAHLRRFHFHPRSEIRRTNVGPEEKRGGKGGGKDPPMTECRRWMKKIQVPGKDYTTLADIAVSDANDDAAEDDEGDKEWQGEHVEAVRDSSLSENVQIDGEPLQPYDGAVNQQISASPVQDSTSLELAMTNDRRFTPQNSDVSFGRLGLPSAFEMPFGTYSDSNATSFIVPSSDMDYSRLTFSSSAPAAPSFLNADPVDPRQVGDNFANSIPSPLNQQSTMNSTGTAHTLEDFDNLQSSYMPGDVSYGMSANNPHFPNGLLEFPPFP